MRKFSAFPDEQKKKRRNNQNKTMTNKNECMKCQNSTGKYK